MEYIMEIYRNEWGESNKGKQLKKNINLWKIKTDA